MSDTPRTDAEQDHVVNLHNEYVCSVSPFSEPECYYVPASFARKMEREIAQLKIFEQVIQTIRDYCDADIAYKQADIENIKYMAVSALAEFDRLKAQTI